MKLFIILVFLNFNICAQDNAPKSFKNSSIERKLENGRVQKFDGDEYMIVKRGSKRKPVIIEKATTNGSMKKKTYKKNVIKLFLGRGPDDLSVNNNEVSLDNNPFLGIGYQKMLNDEFSLEVIGTTNQSLMIGGGFHF